MNHFSSGDRGGNGSLDWVHADEKGRNYTAGVSIFSLGENRWAYGKGGGAIRVATRTGRPVTLQGQASIGGGHSGGAPFAYRVLSGSGTYPAGRRLYLKLGEEYLHIAGTRGHMLTPGVTLLPTHRLAVDLSYTHSAAANFKTEFVSGRLEFASRTIAVFGGFAVGDSIPETVNLLHSDLSRSQNIRDGFVGVTVPLAGAKFTVVSDFLSLGPTRRQTVTLSLKVPLRSQGLIRR
jgi:hypothetical protein